MPTSCFNCEAQNGWIESCIKEELPPTTELEESLRNGVYLAKLGNFFCPKAVPLKKLYDINQSRYKAKGLHFRHTDNINYWLKAMIEIGMPELIFPETTDVYEKKNMPRVIYCLHALSLYLHNSGKAPKIQDLYGKVKFTEEEISAVSSELKNSGIQMPAFSTIGGIVANEVSVDEAAMHTCVFAINEAIDKNENDDLLQALLNPNALLVDIDSTVIDAYRDELSSSKKSKALENTESDSGVDRDAYDEFLTKEEIQECIFVINYEVAVKKIKTALEEEEDSTKLASALSIRCLGFSDVLPQNAEFYFEEFQKFRCNTDNHNSLSLEEKDNLQQAICRANATADNKLKDELAVIKINQAVVNENEEELLSYLQSDDAKLTPLNQLALQLYLRELSANRQNINRDLTRQEIVSCLIATSALANLNFCVDSGDSDATYEALLKEELRLTDLDSECKHNYLTALTEFKKQKSSSGHYLTTEEVQGCVMVVNSVAQEENDRINAIQRANDALKADDSLVTFHELCQPVLGLNSLDQENMNLYHHLLKAELTSKTLTTEDDEVVLWLDEIQNIIEQANRLEIRALKCCNSLTAIYYAAIKNDLDLFRNAVFSSDAGFTNVIASCVESYFVHINSLITSKTDELNEWILFKEDDEIAYFYDLNNRKGYWKLCDNDVKSHECLTKEMIQEVISQVTAEYDREVLRHALEPLIVKFQANVRGRLLRRAFYQRIKFLHSQELYVLKIQSWWRGCKQRKMYLERLNYWKRNTSSIIKVQSHVRMHLIRSKYVSRLKYFQSQIKAIIKVQTSWRASKTRKAFKELMTSPQPSFTTVQMFVHLLDFKNTDFSEELSLHHLQGEVVKTIRNNQQLEQDLSTMDIKIGLLVKNRITLQDVIAHGKKLNKKSKEEVESHAAVQGFKSLNKETQEKIEAYQHLFYLMQSEPRYLSHLIFLMLPIKTTKFIESIVMSLFNYASNQREEYLLLKLFETALNEEIICKVDKPSGVITGNPLIIKMIVGFHRNKRGQSALRDLLGPIVKQVIEDKNLKINTNPVEVYKLWVNQLESQTGQPSGLPYNVDQEEALKNEEVVKLIESSVESLKTITLMFFNAILNSMEKIPYGILYMAKVLKSGLEAKFPEASAKDILKVVGNLLYYRYINPAIVAPDAFSIVDIGGGENLSQEQRRNLGSVAKLLQFSTSKTGFGDETPHLLNLNEFIIDCHEKFKKFFELACEVEDLENHFKIDEYTESTMLTKPTIYVSFQEIRELHKLLLENENVIAPDPDDPLHEHLEDLGEVPDFDSSSEKSDICLTLTTKFKIQESRKNELNQLYVKTKQMIVDIMNCNDANSIPEMLKSEFNEAMNLKFSQLREVKSPNMVTGKDDFLNRSISYEGSTLEETGNKVCQNLGVLEQEGYISSEDNYQEIVNTIAMDIRNRHQYRKRRRQDLMHMTTTLNNLKAKTAFFEEQVDYYHQYIKQCLRNMGPGKKMKLDKKLKTKRTLKYTGSKLHEKGIITEIEGLTKNQFKNVLFEISPSDTDGSFLVKVKYMGTSLADVKLDIQSLLEYQYEGVSVMKMFDRAQVNVNLLLFLLNTKFYGQAK